MTTLVSDAQYAIRVLARRRGFAVAAISTVALAIGANTVIFAVVSRVMLDPLPLPAAERIVRIEERHAGRRLNLTGATFVDLHERSGSFSSMASYRLMSVALSADGVAPEQVTAAEVSSDYFAVLGPGPAAGRLLAGGDTAGGQPPVTLISDAIWRGMFGSDPAIVGRRALVNAIPREIVGVMPRGFFAPGAAQIWIPQSADSPLLRNRRSHLFTVIARVRDDSRIENAVREVGTLAARIETDSASNDPDLSLVATPLQERMVEAVRPALLLVWAAVALVLLIASANLANLLLMQGAARRRELAVRSALGAGAWRMARQLATESLVLGAAGGITGTLLAVIAIPVLRNVLPPALPRAAEIAADPGVLAFGASLSLVTALLFGTLPAWRAARSSSMGTGDRLMSSRSVLRASLVTLEVMLTVVLLATGVVLGRSFLSVMRVDLGLDPSRVLAMDVSLPAARYPDARAHADFHARVLERIALLPGVSAVGVTGSLPMSPTPATGMIPQGRPDGQAITADVITASPGYFQVLRIPLRSGRLFTDADRRGAATVMLISETAAREFWTNGTDPIGRLVTMQDWGAPYTAQVVGVVGNVHQAGPDADIGPAVYYPVAQFPETLLRNAVVLRADGDPLTLAGAAREAIWSVDRDQPIGAVRTMDAVLSGAVATRRFTMSLVVVFATAALLLAAAGIYGVVGFAVGQRTREIGVRMALGARPVHIAQIVLRHGVTPVAAGTALGAVAAYGASGLMRPLVFGAGPTDPSTLLFVCVVVAGAAAAACAGPARRALRVDPIAALRHE